MPDQDEQEASDGQEEADEARGDTPDPSIWGMEFDAFVLELLRRGYHRERPGERQSNGWIKNFKSPLFSFARYVRAYGEFNASKMPQPWTAAKGWVHVSNVLSKHGAWGMISFHPGDAKELFIDAWNATRYIPGVDPVSYALWKADNKTFGNFGIFGDKDDERSPQYLRFIRTVLWLQYTVGEKEPVAIPVKKFAELMSTDPKMVSIWRQRAERDGLIELSKAHSRRQKRATQFWVKDTVFANFAALVKKQQS